ncbi:L-aspartate oxidase [Desulfitispora alkaliphila]|uniref:L-aspartate oxidase n=1 Tax=Desulfitispora alkaliphila TaxID=622674 RepID=UPI003D1EF07F
MKITRHKNKNSDVVIVGTGIAGLFIALNIDKKYKVTLLCKGTLDENNSILAQGGIAASVSPQNHYQDTIKAGGCINSKEAVKVLINNSMSAVEKLIKYGVDFDRDVKGRLKFTREGGHSEKNILHVKDATGREIVQALQKRVGERENIVIKENCFAVDIITVGGRAKAVKAFGREGEKEIYQGKAIVLATGGIGGVYKNTSNLEMLTGDGIAMAYRAGAKIENMEFVQFHPTVLYEQREGQNFLITEAVRGEGGILRNIKGKEFMGKYHPMKELAPRDIVARSIYNEMKETHSSYVYLDLTHKAGDFVKARFPNIYKYCIHKGIDITKEYIPVAPSQHYLMGGIATDTRGRTNIDGLYACGECASTGVHGSNRLASNSLLEAIVFGDRVATTINKNLKNYHIKKSVDIPYNTLYKEQPFAICAEGLDFIKQKIKEMMTQHVAIVRSDNELKEALKEIKKLSEQLESHRKDKVSYLEVVSSVTIAGLIIEGALKRSQSIGAHYKVG